MDKVCTPEEIEKKRLSALQRRQQAQLKTGITPVDSPARQQSSSPTVQQSRSNSSRHFAPQNKSNNRFNPIAPGKFFSQPMATGKCYMVSDDRFVLETSLFVPVIIEIFKTIPSRLYDTKSRIWSFHLNDHDSLMQKLMTSDYKMPVTRIPDNILQIFKRNLKSGNQIPEQDLSKIDKTLTSILMPFQRDGICYGISKSGRCMIADDMGLGKTIQALGIAHYFKESWPLLIVAPSSVKYQWSQAIYEFLPSVPTHYVHHFVNTKDCIDDDKITIISYDLLARAVDVLEKYIYGFIILDESHVLKSSKTARFQAVHRICAHARHIVLLTGTPALSRPIELYSQINLVVPRFMRYEDYGVRYCAGQRTAFGWDFAGSSNLQELQLLLKTNCMIRRLKVDVLNQLPPKIRQVIILDPALIKAGTKQMKEMSLKMQKKATALERHNALLQYYNESSFARLKAVGDYVRNLFENRIKCILYAHHQNVLDAICEVAETMKIRYIRIDGKTSSEQRKLQVDKFQERDDYLAAVLSITAANAGVTLTAAHLVVFTELFWNPGILCQAEDRVHRIGQNSNVVIRYLVARDTADDLIWPLINKKMRVLNAVGLNQDFSIENVDVAVQREKKQRDLTCFLNRSWTSEEGSQHDKEPKDSPAAEDDKKREELAAPEASTSNDFKELLETDEEYFDSCGWDNM
ncbi:PREDICTED: SWI/SNF-related matrix-associated actin-dependent regulator of chromatin subfamily A-like protein 1 [Vollenhovia emeryi]|uniref:SWI/SNF-related matrix-associated actin-dependent regulator of chromatin subfamily A-like protein 1 n=1 Tax=Vollenhovia emeryi TaxID=411798 RepID=UPI0005F3EBDC|nr:PREDICTED: SWI/SNF-related matrix-associated actin-dependent regulator of chromatin subfamily A-like protein 1 [Vollenhovia emeryi]